MQHEQTDMECRESLDVEIEEHIEAAPEELFDYIADGARLPHTDDGAVTLGERRVSDPPYRIEWEAEFTGDGGAYPGTVEITLAPDATGTRVRIVHRTDVQPRAPATCRPRMMALAA